ncbi:MAG: efflux RND transporter permease subunit, partial [Pseudomonadales bacterium]|nr:efflux RND transporter permease subunit [Pseudomonadales bacterium]
MNLAKIALENRTTVLVLTTVFFLGGINSFSNLSWLEDPEFTIKEALVVTSYPGAAATAVEEEVTDEIEIAVQQLAQLDEVESKSERGLSTVTVRIKDNYDKETLPQVWDELRRKVNDAQGRLPPGAGPSIVVDDFSDVYGIFIAITGPEYSYVELQDFAEMLRRELLLVEDVAKIDFWGERTEAIYVEPQRDVVSQLQIVPQQILQSLQNRNVVVDSGRIQVGREYIPVEPTGEFTSVEEIGDLLLATPSPQQIYLRDVSEIRRGYIEPRREALRFDGKAAVGLGISTVSGGNVVNMGEAVQARLDELLPRTPLGIEYGVVSLQSEAVSTAITGFVNSLLQAIIIVIVVLLAFMGLHSGLLIGGVLAVTISATFIFMGPWNVALERISLGALIIALGMLVDNAIVVVDGMLVRIQKGMQPEEAAQEVVRQTALPLLGATAVAIMAFGAIGLSDDSTGEFCRSLFQVVFISLSLSWVTAVTLTPVLGVMILKPNVAANGESGAQDPYDNRFYRAYRSFLTASIKAKWRSLMIVIAAFVGSIWAFGFVNQSFFPDSTRPQFMVDLWLPQGTHIDYTESIVVDAEEYLLSLPESTHVTSLIGAGGLRFMLTYGPERPNSAYAQFLVDVDDYRVIDQLIPTIEAELMSRYPDSMVLVKRFLLGPGSAPIQLRISGPELDELRALATEVENVMHADGGAKAIRTDWRQRTKLIRPIMANDEANRIGIARPDLAGAIKYSFEGVIGGVYREGDDLIPIVFREAEPERSNVSNLQDIQVFSAGVQ